MKRKARYCVRAHLSQRGKRVTPDHGRDGLASDRLRIAYAPRCGREVRPDCAVSVLHAHRLTVRQAASYASAAGVSTTQRRPYCIA